ncbi:MAG: MarC family protein [Thaumarchaeota archaeon]|nr:MarC family protein [Candidatus Calditenuaceae archaeon]MDW8041402.1 MarC family protein [Nitrososphaerota archaeon]
MWWELLRSTVELLIIVDPIGTIPFLVSVTSELSDRQRAAVVNRTVLVSTVLLVLFSLAGDQLLMLFGVKFESFLLAGGSLLVLLAVRILFQGGEGWRVSGESIGTFPLAFPLIAGPGALTSAMISIKTVGPFYLIPVMVVMLATWAVLRASSWFMRMLGRQGADAIARIMAVFIAAIGFEYALIGFRASVL